MDLKGFSLKRYEDLLWGEVAIQGLSGPSRVSEHHLAVVKLVCQDVR